MNMIIGREIPVISNSGIDVMINNQPACSFFKYFNSLLHFVQIIIVDSLGSSF